MPLHVFSSYPVSLHIVSSVAALAAGSLVASIWQGLLLATCVALCLRLLPGLTAATRSLIWTAVLLLVLGLPWLATGMAHGHAAAATAHVEAVRLGERWSLLLVLLWVGLSLFRLGQLGVSAMRLRALARRAVPVEPEESVAALLRNGTRRAELCTSDEVDRPSVAGFFRPRILLPPDLYAKLAASELEQIVLHEMEHLRRRDDWTNLLQKLGLALLPLNPVLLWLDRRLCVERELACDDGVLRTTRARKAYAACLAGLAEDSIVRRGVLLSLGMLGRRRSELERRVYRILGNPEARMGRTQARITTGFLLAGTLAGAVALAGSPKLVSFGPGEPPVNVSVQAATDFGPLAPASTHQAAHPQFVRAVMPAHRAPLTLVSDSAPAGTSATRKPMMVKIVHHSRVASTAPHLVLTGWHADADSPHLVFTVSSQLQQSQQAQTDPQFTYAAIPVRGGWLIVQL